jgi:hypothetical protein
MLCEQLHRGRLRHLTLSQWLDGGKVALAPPTPQLDQDKKSDGNDIFGRRRERTDEKKREKGFWELKNREIDKRK